MKACLYVHCTLNVPHRFSLVCTELNNSTPLTRKESRAENKASEEQ